MTGSCRDAEEHSMGRRVVIPLVVSVVLASLLTTPAAADDGDLDASF
jgi:hypothetical protein